MKYKLCPKCGEKLTVDTHSQLLSSPPQYPIWCSSCGYNYGIDCEEYLKLEGEFRMSKSTIEMEMVQPKEGDILVGIENEKPIYKNIGEIINNKLKMRIKYFEGATKLQKISKGNWIDVYANKDVFVPVGERAMIPLGFALELPQGWEGHLAPRSSTFKTWGVIQTNHVGVVDDTYIGDNDQWHMPIYCLQGKDSIPNIDMNKMFPIQGDIEGTWIRQGDKIGQFRIMEVMPKIEFEEVETFGNADRGGFGTTSSR